MSDRQGRANRDRFPKRKDDQGCTLCRVCGVDHIVPITKGGDEWDLANLELACPDCNRQKGDRVEKEYVVLIK